MRFTEYKYSQDGRSVEVVEGGRYTTTYRLDAWGNVVETTDSEGKMWGQPVTSIRYTLMKQIRTINESNMLVLETWRNT